MNDMEVVTSLITVISIILIPILIIIIALSIVTIIAQWKFYKKCGKNGWEAIIPFYNNWIMIEIAGLNWWYFLILVAPSIITFIVENVILTNLLYLITKLIHFIIYYNIAKKTKQNDILFGILGIFIPIVPIMILGFSKKITYDKNIEVKPNGIF